METSSAFQLALNSVSSYRTYEEWKLGLYGNTGYAEGGSYRTYEEWKRSSVSSSYTGQPSSYRTYEEWKPGVVNALAGWLGVFLPYLWGMETWVYPDFDRKMTYQKV